MAGAFTHAELSASSARTTLRFAVATPADEAALRRLLRENSTPGAISLSFEREPDYFRGASICGADDTTIVADERERLVALGRCSVRDCWLSGEIHRVGYLGELRLNRSVRGRLDLLRRGYQVLRELRSCSGGEFYFTSIASDNFVARRLFERGIPGLPRYEFLTEFITLLIPIRRHGGLENLKIESASADEIAGFLDRNARNYHLAAAWDRRRIDALARHDLPIDRFRVARRDGKIIACAALWDQRAFRQTVIRGYTLALASMRPVLNWVGDLVGAPRLPAPGAVLAQAYLSPLAVEPGYEMSLPKLIAAFSPLAAERGIEWLTLGSFAEDPRLATLRRGFRCRVYSSRLYQVVWPEDRASPMLDKRSFLPEVALL